MQMVVRPLLGGGVVVGWARLASVGRLGLVIASGSLREG